MENKAIPTVEQFIIFKEVFDGMVYSPLHKREFKLSELLHEYAVLFAKHHVQECKEAIKDSVIDQAFKLGIKKQSVESLEYMAENTYDQNNIK